MTEIPQPLDKHDENADRIKTDQSYARSAGTSISAGLPRDENGSTITRQPDESAGRGMNSGLTRALIGGLIGATLGTLAGALANKRTAQGVNHAVKGVGDGVKTVGEGVNHAAKGVGHAVKSVGEGVNHAVIGAVAEGVNNAVVGTLDAARGAAEGVKPSVVGTLDAVKDTAEDAKQSVVGALNAVKDTAEDVKLSGDIPVTVEKRLVVPQTIPVDAETPVASIEANLYQGEVTRQEIYEETADIKSV